MKSLLPARGLAAREIARHLEEVYVTSVIVEGLRRDHANRLARAFGRQGGFASVFPRRASTQAATVILSGTIRQFERLCKEAPGRTGVPEKIYRDVHSLLGSVANHSIPPITYQHKTLDFSQKTFVMGILNVTPDSFYDGGRFVDRNRAVEHALRMEEEGADIIDVGGESTRPGSMPVAPNLQRDRILPVIEDIRRRSDIWISVDTYSSEVARAAIDAGADMINDISGGRFDPDMPWLAAEKGVPIVAMHIRGTPRDMQLCPRYHALMVELRQYFETRLEAFEKAGVAREKVLIDPGIGFGKTIDHNLCILKRLHELRALGRPIVVGTSRKSFIGTILGRGPERRLWGTVAATAISCWNGAHVVRVHDVTEVKDAVTIVRAIREVRCPG